MKGIVLAGGLGTRLLPLTKVTNKHLLPVGNRPMIYYPIQTLVDAGIKDLMVITGGNSAGDFMQLLGNGKEFGLKSLYYAYQEGEGGIADALRICESFAEDQKIAVILGDNLFKDCLHPVINDFLLQRNGARVVLKEVSNPQRFGVPEFMEDRMGMSFISNIQEKPANPPTNFAVTGFYLYDNSVFDIIKSLKPSARGELEITDVNNAYANAGKLKYSKLEGWWTDAGTFDSLFEASQLVAGEV